MADLSKFQELWTDLDPALKEWADEVKALRARVGDPSTTDSLDTMHDRLVTARAAQNRIEAIMSDVGQVRSRLRKLVVDLEADYEDKWAETMQNTRTGEYMSGKAQDATYRLGAIHEQINVRKAKQMLADVEEIYEVVKTKYYGLNNVRADTETSVRIISLESQLER